MKKAIAAVIAVFFGFALFSEIYATPPVFIPEEGAYHGAFVDFGFMEDFVVPEKLKEFEKLSGKKLAIVAMGSFWGKEEFPEGQVEVIRDYGAVPLIYWYPWGPPYQKNEPQQRYSLKSIADGRYDDYIKMWARGAKATGTTLIVSFAPEMNGDWYPWSGRDNGGGETNGFGNVMRPDGPERFVAAWKHVVDVSESVGARNIQWLLQINGIPYPDEEWNSLDAYWPGDSYVDWVGVSAYGKLFPKQEWVSFEDLFHEAYESLPKDKPILVNLAVGEFPDGSKADWIRDAYGRIKKEYGGVKAVVWRHDFWMNEDGSFSDLGINSSDEAFLAYRLAIADPYFIDEAA